MLNLVSERDQIPPSDIVQHLSGQRETLRKLHLDLEDCQTLPAPIPILKDFSGLQEVFLSTIFIYSDMHESPGNHDTLIQILPQSIVSLTLADIVGGQMLARIAKGLLLLADATLQGQFPTLNTVKCYTRKEFDGHNLVDKFASAGVDFGHFLDTRPIRSPRSVSPPG